MKKTYFSLSVIFLLTLNIQPSLFPASQEKPQPQGRILAFAGGTIIDTSGFGELENS